MNAPTVKVSADRQGLEAALPRLAASLRAAGIAGDADNLLIERQFDAGQSNPTYLLRLGDHRIVLRKQPHGALLPRAHDVVREHDLMQALHGAGFAVPRPLFASRDKAILGTDFFVMEFIPGIVHSDPSLPDCSADERAAAYRAMIETMARLHRIDPAVLARAGVKARGDFIGRQISTWRTAYLAAQTTPDDRIEAVGQWLIDNKPARENAAIVHGDYRIENLIFRGSNVAAVLDWELCTIGEPLADLAYCCIWHHLPGSAFHGLADKNLAALGIPSQSELLDIYAQASGIDAAPTHAYFLTFAFYRLAAILQGVHRRALDGNAASPLALERGRVAALCLETATRFVDGR